MLKKMTVALTGVAVFFAFSAGNAFAREYAHEIKDKKMSVAWSVEGDTLAIKMSAETDSWVGVGFNPSNQMKDANFILGYVKKGEAQIIDEFGTDMANHSSDEKLGGTTDATLVGGTEEGGVTTIEFTIPLNSTDKNDGKIDVNGDTTLLMAYAMGRDSFKTKHRFRAEYKVNLSTGAAEEID